MSTIIRHITHAEWEAEGLERFGPDCMTWAFICPSCEHVQTVQDYKDAGAAEREVGFSCVGRRLDGSKEAFSDTGAGPCTYAGGGLFGLNPVRVTISGKVRATFEWAEAS